MKKFKIIKEIKKKKEVVLIQCNKCKKKEKNISFPEIETFRHSFGYGTNKDGLTYEFELCSDCFDKIINNFKIKPKIEKNF